MTRDPGKVAALELRDPKYFIVQERKIRADESGVLGLVMEKFSMPTTLKVRLLQTLFLSSYKLLAYS
jgi:ATP-dependent RNA helicase DDX51/DBP6